MLEQFQLIAQSIVHLEQRMIRMDQRIEQMDQRMEQMDQRMEQMDQRMTEMDERLTREIRESEARTRLYIENTVTKKIDVLFDGYQQNFEKQRELEERTEQMQEQIDDLQVRMAVQEGKTA